MGGEMGGALLSSAFCWVFIRFDEGSALSTFRA